MTLTLTLTQYNQCWYQVKVIHASNLYAKYESSSFYRSKDIGNGKFAKYVLTLKWPWPLPNITDVGITWKAFAKATFMPNMNPLAQMAQKIYAM